MSFRDSLRARAAPGSGASQVSADVGVGPRTERFAFLSALYAQITASPTPIRNRAEQLLWDIEDALLEEEPACGEVLGPEGGLRERFGGSKTVFRQTLRILEAHGVARMRPGPSGGVVVTRPDIGFVVQLLALHLESEAATPAHCVEARGLIERLLTERALGRNGKFGDKPPRSGAPSQADPLAFFAGRVLDALPRTCAGLAQAGLESIEDCDRALAQIEGPWADALARRSGKAADLAERRGRILQIRAMAEARTEPRPGARFASATAPRNRALQIARAILREADPARCLAGERMGSSADLAERFGAAPPIMAQAVRILQAYGVVEIQRGRGGGLVLRSPSACAVVKAVQAYLMAEGVGWDQCGLVWELNCLHAWLAAKRHRATPEVLAVLERLQAARATEEAHAEWMILQKALAEAVGNPVLHTLVRCFASYRMRKPHDGPIRPLTLLEQRRLAEQTVELICAVRCGEPERAWTAQSRCHAVLDYELEDRAELPRLAS